MQRQSQLQKSPPVRKGVSPRVSKQSPPDMRVSVAIESANFVSPVVLVEVVAIVVLRFCRVL